MSQNDFNLANANGATFRADVNSAFQAIASNNGGSSAPGTTYANMWWFDTTNDILKIRDEANANWVNVASLVGTTWIPYSNGSVLGTLANLNASSVSTSIAMAANKSIAGALTSVTSGTPDFATMGNSVTLSSTATANTLGTTQAGFIGIIHYGIAITITHNGTSRILPTAANIVTAAGDVELVLSLGSGNYRTIAFMRADGTAVGAGAATQAQQETGTATTVFVSPGRQQYHESAAKAWARITSVTTTAITDGYNTSSITDNGTGDTTLNLTTAFSATGSMMAVLGVGSDNSALVGNPGVQGTDYLISSTSAIRFTHASGGSGRNDMVLASLSMFGDQ